MFVLAVIQPVAFSEHVVMFENLLFLWKFIGISTVIFLCHWIFHTPVEKTETCIRFVKRVQGLTI